MEIIKNLSIILGVILSVIAVAGYIKSGVEKRITQVFESHNTTLKESINRQEKTINSLQTSVNDAVEKQKAVNEETNKNIQQIAFSLDLLKQYSIEDCRNTIKNIYYDHCDDKKLPIYEKRVLEDVYRLYDEGFHQNSYCHWLYQEMSKWEVVKDD